MTLENGSTVGPFEITGRLGAGGMGEVYRARDTRLGREVALKILPSELAGNPERLERFNREARLASLLTHPNIVVLHETGAHAGVTYLTMELVDGVTLRTWLGSMRPALSKRIAIATQIAEGLAHAHKAGVVHRDLKPDNVMITSDGRAKILDFGIARQLLSNHTAAETQTVKGAGTAEGVLLGTAPYMSPEQSRGDPVDYRSDQFALGIVIYEMVTGTNPFSKGSPLHTLTAIVELDVPPLTATDPSLPAPLSWVVSRCLSKDPADRYDSTTDLARDLKNIESYSSGSGQLQRVSTKSSPRFARAILVGVIALVAASLGWLAASRRRAEPATSAPSFEQLTFRRGLLQSARFTSDGSSVVFSGAWDGGGFELGIVHGHGPDAQRLNAPTAGIFAVSSKGELAISRDCRWIPGGAECLGTLAIGTMGEGAPRSVAEAVISADWSPDGKTLAIVRDDGTLEFPIGTKLEGHRSAGHVRFSRDGALLAFAGLGNAGTINNRNISVMDIRTGAAKTLAEGLRIVSGVAWSPDGGEVWFSAEGDSLKSGIYAVDLNGKRRDLLEQAESVRILDVGRDGRMLVARYTAKADVWVQEGNDPPKNVSWFDFTVADAVSQDGRSLLFSERGRANRLPSYSLFIRTMDGSGPVFLGEGRGFDISPDGKWALANRSVRNAQTEWLIYPTGVGVSRTIAQDSNIIKGWFLPDSKRVLLTRRDGATLLANMDAAGSLEVQPLVPGAIDSPIAPDGDRFIIVKADGSRAVSTLRGPVAGPPVDLQPGELIVEWTSDGTGLWVQRNRGQSERLISRLDLATGRRTEVKVVKLPDVIVQTSFSLMKVTRDLKMIAFTVNRDPSDLILVSGLK